MCAQLSQIIIYISGKRVLPREVTRDDLERLRIANFQNEETLWAV